MKAIAETMAVGVACIVLSACVAENKKKDRSSAHDLFNHTVALVEEYTEKLSSVSDSLAWIRTCDEFEERLEKLNFSYPPDTDLLLTEGQNDTIQEMLLEYVRLRDERIHSILHPVVVSDSVSMDSVVMHDVTPET